MDNHVKDFYQQSTSETPGGHFHKVIPLHDAPEISWKTISKLVPKMSKGWFELAHLSSKDRIDFIREFWLSILPYHSKLDDFLNRFFASLDDIGIFVTQKKFDDPFDVNLVYSLKGNSGFYRGGLPASEDDIINLEKQFPEYILPEDYIAFLRIHDGFWKTTDCTGIQKASHMLQTYQSFQEMLQQEDPITLNDNDNVVPLDPRALIPFYESFGMPFYQCFWGEWYPEHEMGNVYYSGEIKRITIKSRSDLAPENMAFPTFLDWLMFYLERVE